MKKLRIAALILAAALILTVPAAAYTDVGGHWAAESIQFVTDHELFSGEPQGRFEPENKMTRAMAVTVLWRFVGRPAYESPHGFPDAETEAWYSASLRWAKRCGIAEGDEFGRFNPNKAITREEFVTLIFRCLQSEYPDRFVGQMNTPEFYAASFMDHATDHFIDAGNYSEWASPALGWAIETGMLHGDDGEGGSLRPRDGVTRAEAATIFCRVWNWYVSA